MKLASYFLPESHHKSFGLVSDEGLIDLGLKIGWRFSDLKSALEANALPALRAFANQPANYKFDDVMFLPVIENPGKIFCVGMNYANKRVEFSETTSAPTLFVRFADSLAGQQRPVVIPMCSSEFDYEGELAVVIGKPARKVKKEEALAYVAGYSCFMDGTARDLQFSWFTAGKNWAHSGAFGPWLVTADEIPDPNNLGIKTYLNGVGVQSDNTSNMIYKIPELIEYITAFSPLMPGDVIITGSPGGVGKKRNPPLFMKSGDLIEVDIERIGRVSNSVIAESEMWSGL